MMTLMLFEDVKSCNKQQQQQQNKEMQTKTCFGSPGFCLMFWS